jgi:hypothetical protein
MRAQIETPSRSFQVHERGVSSGDHSFHAAEDGKYIYCFNNEHWGANTKEVSFNVHGIVYVPESEAPQDPLEKEGELLHSGTRAYTLTFHSPPNGRTGFAGQGRAGLHCCSRAHTQEHGREHQRTCQVVEHLPALGPLREWHLPGVVAQEVFRGTPCSQQPLDMPANNCSGQARRLSQPKPDMA